MNIKLIPVLELINKDINIDGDYWLHSGNGMIHSLLDQLDQSDWKELQADLATWRDDELSIFTRAILCYTTPYVDVYEVWANIFSLLNDMEDVECLLDDLYLLSHIRNKILLQGVKAKLNQLLKSNLTIRSVDSIKSNIEMIDNFIDSK